MRTTGIIAEYNPFHNGHAHQIATLTIYWNIFRQRIKIDNSDIGEPIYSVGSPIFWFLRTILFNLLIKLFAVFFTFSALVYRQLF